MLRNLAIVLLASTLLTGVSQPGYASGDIRALAQIDLPFEVRAEYDGAGRLRLLHGGELLVDLELWLEGGYEEEAASLGSYGLSTDSGAKVDHPERVARVLQEGMRAGLRGRLGDDDQDGSFDEDPLDGLDNDGDGAIDEDFAAIGTSMRAALADLSPLGLEGARLRGDLYHWSYYHVDAALFWNARIENAATAARVVEASVGVKLDSPHAFEWIEPRVRPHSSVGRPRETRIELPRIRVEKEDGSRLYVGLLRLDGRRGDLSTASDGRQKLMWSDRAGTNWPLAVLVARTEASLLYLAGQSLLTYDRGGAARNASQRWSVPPLCARCQSPDHPGAKLRFSARQDRLRLEVRYDEMSEPEMISHEGFRLGEIEMARWLVAEGQTGATYELPMTSPTAQDVLTQARSGNLRPQLWWATGKSTLPRETDIEFDRALSEAEHRLAHEPPENELPNYLSPRLVQSWPNPFREATTIEVQVPRTLEEAFDLEAPLREKIDLKSAPPFGTQPTVIVRVFNVSGQLIRILDESVRGVGSFAVNWDGSDLSGRAVAAGAYYVNVEMGEWSVTRRVLRLKP